MKYLLILAGGGAGSLLRYLAATAIATRYGGRFLGTFAVNITGCFLIGLVITLCTERFPGGAYWRPLLIVGFLGGFTTFSTFEWETFAAVREGSFWAGMANIAGSVVFGYLAVWLGVLIARK